MIFIFYFGFRLRCLLCKDICRNSYFKNASSLIKYHTTYFACFLLRILFIQKYHFCHHFMVDITNNPTINLLCFYAPPMGYSFNLFLHHPLIPPWTNKRVATLQIFTLLYLIDFTLLDKLLFCIWVYLIKKNQLR